MLGFYEKHPELKESDLIISGESYAGKYIPSMAWSVIEHNDKEGSIKIPLKSVLIGDALVDLPY